MTLESLTPTRTDDSVGGPGQAHDEAEHAPQRVDASGRQVRPVDLSDAALARVTAALAESAEHYDRSGGFPAAGIRVVHEAGLLTLGVGERDGGTGLSGEDSVRVFTALGKGDPSVALITAMNVFQHALQAARPWWPDELYSSVLADSLDHPVLFNAIRAEPEWGAPARGGLPATTITRTGNGWVLNGRKGFATGSEGLDYHLVWAVEAAADGSIADDPLIAHAIVPANLPGIEIVKTWDHLGLRASSTHDVIYDAVELPADHFVGTPVSQLSADPGFGAIGIGATAIYIGVAQAARDFFLKFANERVPTSLGRPIATTERIRAVAGEVEAQLAVAEQLALSLARQHDAGIAVPIGFGILAKPLISRAVIASVSAAVAAIGNPGLSRSNPLERHWRDVQCSRVHPPQEDAALLTAGTLALKRPY
jgi:alkylation response protein AidB-like acyl-CoA dehydrogenase